MSRILLLGLVVLGCGCQSLSGVSDLEVAAQADAGESGGNAGSGGSTGSGGSAGSADGGTAGVGTDAGTGGGAETCANSDQCPGTEGDCATRTCNGGKCGLSFVSDGTELSEQITGDCQKIVCDGAGQTKTDVDDSDVLDDGNECTLDQCESGAGKHPFANQGTACGTGTATHCDGAGACVGCTAKADCPADTQCTTWACASGTCAQTFKSTTTPCGSTQSCSGGTQTNADKCNGVGSCTDLGTTACGAYACGATACNTSCTGAAQCATGNYCGSGTCKPKKTDGSACGSGAECLKGFCVDGVCCEEACDGLCEACSAPNGTCAPLPNMTDPEDECLGGRVCISGIGTTNPACSGLKQCDCGFPTFDSQAAQQCCSSSQCAACPDESSVCAQNQNAACTIGTPTYGYMGPGFGAPDGNGTCPSAFVCALWKCDCVP